MAKTLSEPKPGQKVYQPYAPQKAGVIIKLLGKGVMVPGAPLQTFVRVKWLNGEVTDVVDWHLQDFDALIADHKKKLATHLATLAKLEAL